MLLAAIEALPPAVKCLLAGDGPQVEELRAWMSRPGLSGRVFYVGLLDRARLWSFYKALDCQVLPSLTRSRWKEQFGGVLAEGMAMGLPLIGSDSGSIPEVIGPAGIAVAEADAGALASAIRRVAESPELRQRFSEAGKRRFREEFDIPAYGRKIARALGLVEREAHERE